MPSIYPRIRIPGPFKYTSARDPSEAVEHEVDQFLVRDLVRFVFFVPRDHFDIASEVSHALDSYLRAVAGQPDALFEYTCCDWEPSRLGDLGWERIRNTLSPGARRYTDDADHEERLDALKAGSDPSLAIYGKQDSGFSFDYQARIPWRETPRNSVSVLRATLPTEFLEARGADFVREFALDMASRLPFASGHVGLALDVAYANLDLLETLRPQILRHPGFDLRDAGICDHLGTQVDGVHWMNFLGQPVLGELGGVSELRAKLQSHSTSVQDLDGERVLVTLGAEPEAGDLIQGQSLPAYRELARALEPWREPFPWASLHRQGRGTEEETLRQWWRRFLD